MDLGLEIFDDPHLRNIKLIGEERLQVGELIENIFITILFAFALTFAFTFITFWFPNGHVSLKIVILKHQKIALS